MLPRPFSAIYLTCYEELKKKLVKYLDKESEKDLPFFYFGGGGILTGSFSAFITSPLDMAKLCLQVQRGNEAFGFQYKNMFHGVSEIAKKEGIKGLFRGSLARMAFHGPSTGIVIGCYDGIRHFVQKLLDEEY